MQIDKKKVGEKIHQIRKHNGYSMEQFGKQIGDAPKGSVNSWEKGVNLPNKERLELIAIMGNTTVDELLYGALNDYVSDLIETSLGIKLSSQFIAPFVMFLESKGFTYGNDVEILRFVKGFLNQNNVITKRESLIYRPASEQDHLFIGFIHVPDPDSIPKDPKKQKIQDYSEVIKNDKYIPQYFAYSDSENNTLHVMPYTLNNNAVNYSYPTELTHSGEHDYFTSGFIALGLKLLNFKMLFYGLDAETNATKISKFTFDVDSDSLHLYPGQIDSCEIYVPFQKNMEKESLYIQSNPQI